MKVVETAPQPTTRIPNLPWAGATLDCFISLVWLIYNLSLLAAKVQIIIEKNKENLKKLQSFVQFIAQIKKNTVILHPIF
jgi:hypothetical protein